MNETEFRTDLESVSDVLDRITDGLYALDREWRLVFLNRRAMELAARLNLPREQLIGRMTLWELIPDLVNTVVWDEYHRAMRDQVPVSFELHLPTLQAWFQVRGYPSKEGLTVFYDDITEKKQAHEAMLRLASIVESSHDAIFSKTLDGIVTSWNQSGVRMYGYKAEEVVGKHVSMLAPAEQRAEFDEILAKIRRGEPTHRETVRLRKDGERFPALITVSPLHEGSKIIGASSIVRDLFFQKQTEKALQSAGERLRLAAEATGLGIWEMDPSSGSIHADENCRRMFNLKANEKFDYALFISRLHPEDREGVDAAIRAVLKGGKKEYEEEYRTLDDRGERWIAARGVALCEPGDSIKRFIGTVFDITGRKHLEDALRQADRLMAAGRMAATVAHEINNPLEAVTNLLFLMRTQDLPEAAREYLNVADRELSRVTHITRQTLEFHRVKEPPQRVDIVAILDEAVEAFSKQLRDRRIILRRKYKGFGHVIAHPGEMRQVFTNLMANAIEAGATAISLSVAACCDWTDKFDTGLRIVVADNGPGIAPAERKRIFEPFFTTKVQKGTGLGLWVTQGIIQKYHGRITLKTRTRADAHGTCISIFMPAIEAIRTEQKTK